MWNLIGVRVGIMLMLEMLTLAGLELVPIGLGNRAKEDMGENVSVLPGIFVNMLCCHWLMLHIGCSEAELMLQI